MSADLPPVDLLEAPDHGDHHLDPARRARIRAEVLRRVAEVEAGADPAATATPIRSAPRFRPRPGPLVLAAASILLVVAVAVTLAVRGGEPTDDVDVAGPNATELPTTLDELADVAAARPDRPLEGPDAVYSYVNLLRLDEERLGEQGEPRTDRYTFETWTAADGTGRERSSGAATDRTVDTPGELLFGEGTYDQLRAVGGEPFDVLRQLYEPYPEGRLQDHADRALRYLAQPSATPSGRADVIRALGRVGFTPLGPTRDPEGRLGIGFAFLPEEGDRIVAVFDPETSALLANTETVVGEGLDTTVEPPELVPSRTVNSFVYLDAEVRATTDD